MDKLRTITYFLRVVEARSFAAAAHQVDLTPSALSRAIGSLEQQLGFTLFDRSTRHLVLTEEGRAYYDVCRRLLEELEDVELASARAGVKARGRLRIGTHPALRTALLSDFGQFLADHVELSLEMIATNSPAAVLDQGLDVVLSIGQLADSGLVARPLGSVEFIVVASPGYLRRHPAPTSPEDLLRHRAIVYGRADEEPADRWHFSRGEEQRSIEVPVALMVRDGLGAIDAALLGIGILRPYSIAVAKLLAEGRLVPLLRDWSSGAQPVHALYSRRKHPSAKVGAFIDYAAKALSKPVVANSASLGGSCRTGSDRVRPA